MHGTKNPFCIEMLITLIARVRFLACISSHMYKQMLIFAEIFATFITGIYFYFISVLRFLLNVPTALTDMAMFNVAMPLKYFYL